MSRPRLLAIIVGLLLAAGAAGLYLTAPDTDRDNLATTGLTAIVEGTGLRVVDRDGHNAGAVDHLPVDGHVAWSTDAASLGFGRGDTLYWAPTNLQFTRKIGSIAPGSRFFWSPSGREVLVQTGSGVAIVDKTDKQIWKMDGVQPLGWWVATGLYGQAVVVTDGTRARIVSTYNNEALWTFDVAMAIPSPAGPVLLLPRADGWAVWEPTTGARPIPGVPASASAAWEPNGQRAAIEAPGSAVVVTVVDLKTSPLGAGGAVTGWARDFVALTRDGAVKLVRPGTKEVKDFGAGAFAALQPDPPKPKVATKPGQVKFNWLSGLRDGAPAAAVQDPNGQILYVADLMGRVVADRGGQQATLLDLRGEVTAFEESGLLDIVLHPKFAQNRTAYVYYGVGGVSDKGDRGPRRNLIASFQIAADGMSVTPGSFQVRHSVPTPQQTPLSHNGGTIAFGPDGRLYLGLGDLGNHEAAADPNAPSGNFFSFDVDQAGTWTATRVAYGFRNPFRFAFDPVTAQMWIGDVGGNMREEIDVLTRGGNFGWPLREGEICRANEGPCDAPGIAPVYAWWPYSLKLSCGSGVIGGFVYRGAAMPALQGWYLYSDLCSGEIRAIDPSASTIEPIVLGVAPGAPADGVVVDVTPDAKGEPLVVGLRGGVWRLTPAGN